MVNSGQVMQCVELMNTHDPACDTSFTALYAIQTTSSIIVIAISDNYV